MKLWKTTGPLWGIVLLLSATVHAQVPTVVAPAKVSSDFYEFVSKLTPENQKLVFSGLAPEGKEQLWREHLKQVERRHPELTSKQRGVLREAQALIDSGVFRQVRIDRQSPPDYAIDLQLDRLHRQAVEVLGSDLAFEALAQLGYGEAMHLSLPQADLETAIDAYGVPFTRAAATDLPQCTCTTYDDWCGLLAKCEGGGCYFSTWGCGTLFAQHCVGLCQAYENCGCPGGPKPVPTPVPPS